MVAERRDMLTERADEFLALRVVQRAETAEESQHHDSLEAGHDGVVWSRFAQHITHPIAQRIASVHGAEEVPCRSVIPLHTGVILHAAIFDRLIKQRTLCSENMLTAGFIEFARFQLTLDTFDISNAALPQRAPFSILKFRAMTQADRLQPVSCRRASISMDGGAAFTLTHVRSTAKSSSSGSPSIPGT